VEVDYANVIVAQRAKAIDFLRLLHTHNACHAARSPNFQPARYSLMVRHFARLSSCGSVQDVR
jgi:hypothetical protein